MHTRVVMRRKRSGFVRVPLNVGLDGENRFSKDRDHMQDMQSNLLLVMLNYGLCVLNSKEVEVQ